MPKYYEKVFDATVTRLKCVEFDAEIMKNK